MERGVLLSSMQPLHQWLGLVTTLTLTQPLHQGLGLVTTLTLTQPLHQSFSGSPHYAFCQLFIRSYQEY